MILEEIPREPTYCQHCKKLMNPNTDLMIWVCPQCSMWSNFVRWTPADEQDLKRAETLILG
jgi:ribosomal protein L37AE/L43A